MTLAAAALVEADAVRSVVLTLVALAVAGFPAAVLRQGRPASAIWAVIGCELALVSGMIGIADQWGRPLVWYRTPTLGLAACCILVFVGYALAGPRSPR